MQKRKSVKYEIGHFLRSYRRLYGDPNRIDYIADVEFNFESLLAFVAIEKKHLKTNFVLLTLQFSSSQLRDMKRKLSASKVFNGRVQRNSWSENEHDFIVVRLKWQRDESFLLVLKIVTRSAAVF